MVAPNSHLLHGVPFLLALLQTAHFFGDLFDVPSFHKARRRECEAGTYKSQKKGWSDRFGICYTQGIEDVKA